MATMQLVLLAAVFGMMYFMVIRPQKKRQEELMALRSNLKVGDKITTIGGIVAEITAVDDVDIHVISAGTTTLVFRKSAVASVNNDDDLATDRVDVATQTDSIEDDEAERVE